MKKVLVTLICFSLILGVFAACAKDDGGKKETTKAKASTTQEITTDDAKITEADAINLIESYSAKDFGLTKEEMNKCSFLVKKSGVSYKNNYYVNVIATVKTAHKDTTDKKGKKVTTYTFDNKGEYLIRYDGKQILAKNGDDKDYRELKVKAVPTTKPVTNADETTKKAEKTTKKK